MTGRQAANRRRNAQPTPVSSGTTARPRRTTRSQSRDPEVEPVTTRRRTRALSEDTEEERNPKQKATITSRRKNTAALPAVGEEADSEEVDIQDGGRTPPHRRLSSNLSLGRSPGGMTTMSGTTALSQDFIESVPGLDLDKLRKHLPQVRRTADDVLLDLCPEEATERRLQTIIADAKDPRTTVYKLAADNDLRSEAETFTEGNWIDSQRVLRSLVDAEATDFLNRAAPWRPDGIFDKVNTALLVLDILQENRRMELLEALNDGHAFPQFFVSYWDDSDGQNVSIGGSSLKDETFDICLNIRTQLVIMELDPNRRQVQATPLELLYQQFYSNGPADHVEDDGTLNPEGLRDMAGMALTEAGPIQQILHRLDSILGFFSEGAVDWLALRAKYPWARFAASVLRWARQRDDEIEHRLKQKGGLRPLIQEVRDRATSQVPHEQPTRSAGTEESQDIFQLLRQMRRQNEAERRTSRASDPVAKPQDEVEPSRKTDPDVFVDAGDNPFEEFPIAEEDDDEEGLFVTDDEPVARPTLLQRLDELEQLPARTQTNRFSASGRPASFLDRQPNAQKVRFAASDSPSGSQTPELSGERSPLKRSRVQAEESDEESDGFEVDTRVHDVQKRRREISRAVPSSSLPPQSHQPKRSRLDTREPIPSSSAPGRSSAAAPRSSGIAPRSSGIGPRSSGLPASSAPSLSSQRAVSAANEFRIIQSSAIQQRADQNRRPAKSRTPYTATEEEALIGYIARCGVKWAKIKRTDDNGNGYLAARTAEDLRQKARNMKVIYLQARQALPLNFDQVAIQTKQREDLLARGIEVD